MFFMQFFVSFCTPNSHKIYECGSSSSLAIRSRFARPRRAFVKVACERGTEHEGVAATARRFCDSLVFWNKLHMRLENRLQFLLFCLLGVMYKERCLFDCWKAVLTLTVLETMYHYWKYAISARLNAELSTSAGY
ncbi:unnamed protein product [Cylicocyclus nassatus]|uniref:Uncharacterized protein n=1 Tax=Cylicocyclus nassatus TaxID=53992 RepID=A0AA36DQ26_CYLNA|nr:unnamed protein product [Cylicocyclus nassatus]